MSSANDRAVNIASAYGRSRVAASVATLLAGIGLGLSVTAEHKLFLASSYTSASGIATEIGRFAGIVGTYGIVLTLFLIARIPWLEREVGMDRTLHWHRTLAPWSMLLIGLHVVFILLGYSLLSGRNVFTELWMQVTTLRWILPAAVAFVLFIMASVSSYRKIKSKIKYETWWVIHLYTYIAVALAFAHQITLGTAFATNKIAANAWLGLTLTSVGSILFFRWIVPIFRALKYRLRVYSVVPEGPGVVSVWITGTGLHRMKARGGQFFMWRFLAGDSWWQAHPYSLSAPPDGKYLRITVKHIGDHSVSLANLAVGTRVLAEGPYGAFTAAHREGNQVVLVAAGVGVTPIRAIIEELPRRAKIEVLYRARTEDDLVLKHELEALGQRPNTSVHYLVGSRAQFPMDAEMLKQYTTELADSDIYICGPAEFTNTVRNSALECGIPRNRIHDEAFAF